MDGIITFEQGKRTSEERRLMERAKWAQQKRDERIENNAGNFARIRRQQSAARTTQALLVGEIDADGNYQMCE